MAETYFDNGNASVYTENGTAYVDILGITGRCTTQQTKENVTVVSAVVQSDSITAVIFFVQNDTTSCVVLINQKGYPMSQADGEPESELCEMVYAVIEAYNSVH